MAVGWHGSRGAGGDDAWIRSLYEQHGRAVLAYAMKLTRDRGTAEDVLQETLVRAWSHSENLINGKGSVRAWLFTVANHIVVDRARARAARPKEALGFSATDRVQRDHADRVINSIQVFEELQKLSQKHREVIVQVYFHHHDLRETAQALGIPEGTVKSRLYHALRALRRLLEVTP